MKQFYLLIFLLGLGPWLYSQDVHFSQFDRSLWTASPAETGAFDGRYRANLQLREQWSAVPVAYQSLGLGLEQKEALAGFHWGLYLQADQAGDLGLGQSLLRLSLARTQPLSANWSLNIGGYLGAGQRFLNYKGASFDEQFQGDQFDPSWQLQEPALATAQSFLFSDLGAGLALNYQGKNWQLKWGLGLFHLNQPKQSFLGEEDRYLPIRQLHYIQLAYGWGQKWKAQTALQFQQQGPYREWSSSQLFFYALDQRPGRELSLYTGLSWRYQDSWQPRLGIQYQNNWELGLSYDVNYSDFQPATLGQGGFELLFVYIWRPLPKFPSKKNCPIL